LTITADCAVTVSGPLTVTGTLTISAPVSTSATNLTLQGTSTMGTISLFSGSVLTLQETSSPITVTINAAVTTVPSGASVLVDPSTKANTLQVLGDLTVAAGGVITADGRGCPASQSAQDAPGGGCLNVGTGPSREGADSPTGGGGAHGGAGGNGVGSSGGTVTYGDPAAPVLLGSGGGKGLFPGSPGGPGGGAIRLNVSGNLTVDGRLSADGGSGGPTYSDGGGSGGSVYITIGGTLSGSGAIQANGAAATSTGGCCSAGGGGGGGRVAIYYSAFGTMPAVTATGGAGSQSAGAGTGTAGQAGSVYLAGPQPATVNLCSSIPGGTYTNLTITADCAVTVSGPLTVTGTLTISAPVSTSATNLTLQGTSTIQTINPLVSGSTLQVQQPPQIDQFLAPSITGTNLTSAQKLGQTFTTGVQTTSLTAIDVSGMQTSTWTAQTVTLTLYDKQGAGRVALGPAVAVVGLPTNTRFTFATPITVNPSTSYYWELTSNSATAILVDRAKDTYAGGQAFVGVNPQGYDFAFMTLQPAGSLVTVTINTDLIVQSGATVLVNSATQANTLQVLGNLTVQSGGVLQADGLGCPISLSGQDVGGCANEGSATREGGDGPGSSGGGGAHGGVGGNGTGSSGGTVTYGNPAAPVLLGSGGGQGIFSGNGAAGGGAMRLIIGGNLTVDGRLSADGSQGSIYAMGSGSGGSVYVTVGGTLSGTGSIQANGPAATAFGGCCSPTGGGGGGRVAIYYSGVGTMPTVTATGGAGVQGGGSGQAGTVTLVSVDHQPPAPISPLTVGTVTSVSATLQWTSTGNNGTVGTATVYDLRYILSAPGVMSETQYQTAFQVSGEPAPLVSGTSQSMPVTGLTPSTNYCFAIKAIDAAGNVSALDVTGTYSTPGVPGTTSTACFTTQAPDTTPPAAVSNLAAVLVTSGAYTYTDRVKLTWTAVGDDNNTGTAASYQLRYSLSPITSGNFSSATLVTGVPVTQAAGGLESFTVTGLQSNVTYYFAMTVSDEVPNASGLSNVASIPIPLDTTPPGTITTLAIGSTITASTVALTFTSTGDDGTPPAPFPCPCYGTPTSYIVKYQAVALTSDPNPIVDQATFDAATTFGGSIVPLAAGQTQTVTVGGLIPGTRYYFSVEAVDEKNNRSYLGNVVTAKTLAVADTIPPGAITDLRVVTFTVTDRTVQLQWTARGDDGDTVGTATAFDLRWSHTRINNDGDFSGATQIPGTPLPGPPGAGQSMTVTLTPFQSMTSNTVYYFAIKAIDDGGLRSTLGTLTNTNDGTCTNKCSVRTALRTGYNIVSVPLTPSPDSPALVFGPLDGLTDPCGSGDVPCLYEWISTGLATPTDMAGDYQLMDPYPTYSVTAGTGYFFYTNILPLLTATGSDVTPTAADGHMAGLHAHFTLQQGWNIVGNLFKKDVTLSTVNIRRVGGGGCVEQTDTFAAAVAETPTGWVGNAIYIYDGAGNVAAAYNGTPPVVLQPWQGYWFQVLKNDCTYELVIPKPS
jgi:hypothetical protein